MKIIDTHLHLWDIKELRYSWLDSVPAISATHGVSEIQKETKNIDIEKFVFVQCGCDDGLELQEVKWVVKQAEIENRISGIVAAARLEEGEGVEDYLETLKTFSLVKGVRRLIQSEKDGFCIQPDFVKGVQSLMKYNFSFDICVYQHQLKDVIQLVDQCPGVQFVLDHIGKPLIGKGEIEPWGDHLKKLASYKNVQCKMSGLVTEADVMNWNVEQLKPYIQKVVEVFGEDRIMYGGDWPVVKLACSYENWFKTIYQELVPLGESALVKIFKTNAETFYRL